MNKLICGALCLLINITSYSQDFSNVSVNATKVAGDVYMITGYGGNIGVLATDKGLLLVDDQFQPLAEKIEQAMSSLSSRQLKYVVNTHYHSDHVGSNEYFAHKAPILAHENVRSRLSKDESFNGDALPVVTYKDGVTIHLENEEIQLIHLPKGHTDGDTIVYFKKANVLHTGDLFFQGRFPFIDLDGGGTVKGYLANVRNIIATMPDDVTIIPGHGEVTNKAGYQAFADMLAYSIELVSSSLEAGKSEQDILAQGIDKKYKSLSWAFISEERWLKTLIRDLYQSH